MPYVIAPEETDGERAGAAIKPRGIIMSPEPAASAALTSVIGTGSATISGTITVGGVAPTNAYAVLCRESDGVPLGRTAVAPDGTYAFTLVGPANYAVVILDATGTKRAKVLHTVLA